MGKKNAIFWNSPIMNDFFMKLHEFFNNKTLKIKNEGLNKIIQRYNFYNISDLINQQIYDNFKQSKSAIIHQIFNNNVNGEDSFFIICFKNTIISINQTSVKLLQNLFSSNDSLTVHFISDSCSTFSKMLKIKNLISFANSSFEEEIETFSKEIELKTELNSAEFEMWNIISSCISGYLIRESYEKTDKNRLLSFQNFYINKKNVFMSKY